MKKITNIFTAITLTAVILTSNLSLKAQDRVTPTWWFGIAGAANFNFYRGETQVLDNSLTTKYAFEHGFGVAPYAAIFAEYRPGPVWGAMFNFAYDARRGLYNQDNQNSGATLQTQFNYLVFEPSLRIAPFGGNFYIFLGPRLSYNISNEFVFYQPISPSNTEAEWNDVYGLRISAQIGAGYEIPLSAPASTTQVNLSPFISFIPYFGQEPRSIDNMTLTTVRVGVALKFGCGKKQAAPAAIEVTPVQPDVQFSVQSPSSVPSQHVVKETLPLCSYVFFDSGSTEIPTRYILLTKDQAPGFSEVQLQDCQKNPGTRSTRQLTMYYNGMNIVADRMKKHPSSTIRLVGSSAGAGPEIGKLNAEAVKSYFVNVFGIASSRIVTEGRNEPLIPSQQANNTHDFRLTRAEDNRVDIVSTSPDLMMEVKDNSALCLKPIEVTAMDGSSMDDAPVTLNVNAANTAFTSWSVDVTSSAGTSEHFGPFTGNTATISGSAILQNNKSGNYTIIMTGQTKDGNSITKQSSFTLVREVQPNQPEERVSILFEFDKSKTVATFNDFLTNTVAPLIPSNAKVTISGYTDIIGTADYNLSLSVQRAQQAQSILEGALAKTNTTGVTFKTNGYGEVGTSFSNNLPEERFYNRTVIINIIPSGTLVSK